MPAMIRGIRLSSAFLVALAIAACNGSDDGPDDPVGTSVEFSYCVDKPFWVAVQDDDGPWTRVLPVVEGTYEARFQSGRGGVAAMFPWGLQVNYGTLAEIATIHCDQGYKFMDAAVSGIVFPERATAFLGSAGSSLIRDSVRFRYVADGPQDLFASRRTFDGVTWHDNSIIIRRGLDVPSNTTLATIDFNAPEAFVPVESVIALANLGSGSALTFTAAWYGHGGARGSLLADFTGPTSGWYGAVPAEKLASGELSSVDAAVSDGDMSGRYALEYFRTPADVTIEMGPVLSAPTVMFPASGAVILPRAQLASQPEYGRMVVASFNQNPGGGSAIVAMSSAYLGGTPATWDLQVPDLSLVDGWNSAWSLRASMPTGWTLVAEGGVDRYLGDVAHDGDRFQSATVYDLNTPATVRAPSGGSRREPHRGGFPRAQASH